MATKFLESGGNATYGFDFWETVVGTSSMGVVTGGGSEVTRNGNAYAIQLQGLSGNSYVGITTASLQPGGNAGRLNFFINYQNFNTTTTQCLVSVVTAGGFNFSCGVTSSGATQIYNAFNLATSGNPTGQIGSNGPALGLGRMLRICLVWSITNATTYTITLFVDGLQNLSVSNSTALSTGGVAQICIGETNVESGDADYFRSYMTEFYVDDSNSLADVGDICITTKRGNALNTNNFDTLGGSGTNRYDRVSDRPLSVTNYIEHAGATDVQENFTLQSANVGDGSINAGTIVSRRAWVYAARGPILDGTPSGTGSNAANSSGTTVACTLSSAVAANDYVVVAVADQMTSTTTVTISDNIGGNTWTALSGPTTNTIRANKWYSKVTNGGATFTVTATFTSQSASRAIVAAVWPARMFGASPLDSNVTNSNDSTTPFTCPLSGTLAQAKEIVLGFTYSAGNTDFTATSPNLLAATAHSTGGSATSNAAVALGYQLTAATTSIAPVFAGTSRTSVQGTASFKVATTLAAGTPKIMDNGSESAIVLPLITGSGGPGPSLFSVITDSASYPSNAAGIGMRSSGSGGADTYFYEGGTLIAYKPLEPLRTFNKPDAAVMRAATW